MTGPIMGGRGGASSGATSRGAWSRPAISSSTDDSAGQTHEIISATSGAEVAAVRELLVEYAASLDLNLTLQHFDVELASLPGSYAAPRGALLLARVDGAAAGCIGLRPFSESAGELKRLYLRPAFRGRGLAHSLVSAAIAAAKRIGYGALVLDSHESMQTAMALYESFGFQRTEPYWSSPLPNIQYFRLSLEPNGNA